MIGTPPVASKTHGCPHQMIQMSPPDDLDAEATMFVCPLRAAPESPIVL